MVVIGYRWNGEKYEEVFRVDGTQADEKSKGYLLFRKIPIDEDYITEHMRSNFYFLLIKVHEDGTSEVIDDGYHMRNRTHRGKFVESILRRETSNVSHQITRIKEEVTRVESLAKPDGVTVKELKDQIDVLSLSSAISILEKRYRELWEKEPLVYADAYINFLENVGDYYATEHNKEDGIRDNLGQSFRDPFEEWLKILDGTDYSKQRAVKYYSEASRISTSVSMMYFPEQNCPDEAEKYLKKAIGLAEKIEALNGPTENHWVYFNNLGTHYYETYRPKEALSVLLNGLQYAKNDNARTVLFHNISLCYADLGDIKAAVEYLIRSICLHYSTQNEYGHISEYNKDIERIINMTQEHLSDATALRIALDIVGGNLTQTEACQQLKLINLEEWPFSKALWELLCNHGKLENILTMVPGECKSVFLDILAR